MTSHAFNSRKPESVAAADPLVPPKSGNDNEASGGANGSPESDDSKRSELTPTRGTLGALWQAYWVCTGEQLSAEDSASTIFQFFRSTHVLDLKLFFKLALYLFLAVIIIGAFYAVAKPAVHLASHPTVGAIFYHGRRAFFLHIFDVSMTNVLPALATFVAPAITICGGIMAWTYLSAATRLGVVDLFACEIRTICRVGTAFDIGRHYVVQHQTLIKKANAAKKHAAHEPPAEPAARADHTDKPPEQPKGFSSQEDYFPVFTSNSHDLEALEALVVGYITEFYTYMKATRDLQRSLAENPSLEAAIQTLENLIYVLFLGYESARKAVEDLIEYEPTRAENMIVILTTELECYWFLCKHFEDKEDELRAGRLKLRRLNYMEEIPDLFSQIDASRGSKNEKDWNLAKNTTSEVKSRYERTFGETMAAAIARRTREKAAQKQTTP